MGPSVVVLVLSTPHHPQSIAASTAPGAKPDTPNQPLTDPLLAI